MRVFSNLKAKWNTLRQREKEKMQNMTFKQKVSYIFTAWGLEIVIGLVILLMLGFGIYLVDNATSTYVLTVGIVDSRMEDQAIDAFAKEFKEYSGKTHRKERISVEANIPSESGSTEAFEDYYMQEMQQMSLTLAASGVMDCYIVNESYMQFLKGYEVLMPVEEALGAMAGEYEHLITEDGFGLALTSAGVREYFELMDGEYYLVYLLSLHYPDVVQSFTRFVLEK